MAGNACHAILLTTIWDTRGSRFDHDHGCKLPGGHDRLRDARDALHECVRCGERWASATALASGSAGAGASGRLKPEVGYRPTQHRP